MADESGLAAAARHALDRVRTNPADAALFRDAYAGEGDAIEALRAYVEPDPRVAIERERLRAIAFGRATTPDELARAEQARADLDGRDAAAATARDTILHAIASFDAAETADDSDTHTDTDPDQPELDRSQRPRRRGRVLLFALACVLLGGLLASVGIAVWVGATPASIGQLLSGTSSSPADYGSGADGAPSALADDGLANDPATSGLTDDELAGGGLTDDQLADKALVELQLSQDSSSLIARASRMLAGDVGAATEVLNRHRTASDKIPGSGGSNIDASTSRRIWGGGKQAVYVAISTDHELCMVVVRGEYSATTCAPPDQFARFGLWAETSGGDSPDVGARWDGNVLQLAVEANG